MENKKDLNAEIAEIAEAAADGAGLVAGAQIEWSRDHKRLHARVTLVIGAPLDPSRA